MAHNLINRYKQVVEKFNIYFSLCVYKYELVFIQCMKKEIEIIRYNPEYSTGLNEEQIKERQLHKLNKVMLKKLNTLVKIISV